jgi:mRNA interferase MazF
MKDSKFRPALVVSNDEHNENNADVVICAITSKLDKNDYGVFIGDKNIENGKMPLKSLIRADKILCVEKSIIEKPFARLGVKTFDEVTESILKLLKRRN